MDALSQILRTLKLHGSLYFRTDLSAPWGLEVPREGRAVRFHVAIKGTCWLRVASRSEALALEPGDLVLLPHGRAHRLSDAKSTPCRPLLDILQEQHYTGEGILRYGGGGALAQLICGYFGFDSNASHPLLASLPETIHLRRAQTQRQHWLATMMELIGDEAGSDRLGSHALVDRLSEVLFIQIFRAYIAMTPDLTGCLAALSDAHMSQALNAMHGQPAQRWTVQMLARLAGLSRSAFAARFTQLMGVPPLRYLTQWRLELAKQALETSGNSIPDIAEQVGYRSEAAFITVFKRHLGCTPSVYRRR